MGALFIPRGNHLVTRGLADGAAVSATMDGIFEWDTATRVIRRRFPFTRPQTPHLVSLEGDVFFTDGAVLHVWRRRTGESAPIFTLPATRSTWKPVAAFSVSADGTHVAALEDGGVVAVTRLSDGARVAAVPDGNDARFGLAHGGRWLLFATDVSAQSGSGWTDYRVIEVASGKGAGAGTLIGDDAYVGLSHDGLAVDYDGRQTGSDPFDPAIPRVPRRHGFPGARWRDDAVPFAHGPAGLVALCGDQLIPIDGDRPLLTDRTLTKAAGLSQDGGWLALLQYSHTGAVLPTAEPARRRTFEVPKNLFPDAVAALDDGRVVMATRGRVVWLDGPEVRVLPETAVRGLSASRDGSVLAVLTGYARQTEPLIVVRGTAVEVGPACAADCLTLRPDGALLAVSTPAGIAVWETGPLRQIRTIPAERALALAFSPDGQRLHALHDDLSVRTYPD